MCTDKRSKIPEDLIFAQELQKARDYSSSRKLYKDFFDNNPDHYLRFKALFEVADNWYHQKNYEFAQKAFLKFIEYCNSQINLTEQENDWIKYYKRLAISRINSIICDKKSR